MSEKNKQKSNSSNTSDSEKKPLTFINKKEIKLKAIARKIIFSIDTIGNGSRTIATEIKRKAAGKDLKPHYKESAKCTENKTTVSEEETSFHEKKTSGFEKKTSHTKPGSTPAIKKMEINGPEKETTPTMNKTVVPEKTNGTEIKRETTGKDLKPHYKKSADCTENKTTVSQKETSFPERKTSGFEKKTTQTKPSSSKPVASTSDHKHCANQSKTSGSGNITVNTLTTNTETKTPVTRSKAGGSGCMKRTTTDNKASADKTGAANIKSNGPKTKTTPAIKKMEINGPEKETTPTMNKTCVTEKTNGGNAQGGHFGTSVQHHSVQHLQIYGTDGSRQDIIKTETIQYLLEKNFLTLEGQVFQSTRISISCLHLVTLITSYNPLGDRALLRGQATFFDRIADLANQKFDELNVRAIGGTIKQVSSALIMKCCPGDPGTVVSFGTGTRCVIHGNCLGHQGETVNDSHAEIITKRGFMRFLYRQLQRHRPGDPNSMFEPSGTSEKLRVKSNFSFHLYISTAPCGAAAMWSSFSGTGSGNRDSCHNNQPFRPTPIRPDLLHTKGDQGYIPVPDGYCSPSWFELQHGARLRTMSCSDKVCRWNVLGLQGGLLSLLIDPVYLDSITLGFQYDEARLSRATSGRLKPWDPIRHLPVPYKVNQPYLGRVTAYNIFPKNAEDFNELSINWNLGEPTTAEVTDGNTGKLLRNSCGYTVSRLSKRVLFEDFKETYHMLRKESMPPNTTYLEAKDSATNYQKAKESMVGQFRQKGLGNWVRKPREEELFST